MKHLPMKEAVLLKRENAASSIIFFKLVDIFLISEYNNSRDGQQECLLRR